MSQEIPKKVRKDIENANEVVKCSMEVAQARGVTPQAMVYALASVLCISIKALELGNGEFEEAGIKLTITEEN